LGALRAVGIDEVVFPAGMADDFGPVLQRLCPT
jgi:hypothetical protein